MEFFHEWFVDYFYPLLQQHHVAEEEVVFPFYLSLGATSPERESDDHITLIGKSNKVKLISSGLLQLFRENEQSILDDKLGTDVRTIIKCRLHALKKEFLELIDHLRDHFQDEELHWSEVIKQYGEVYRN